MSPLLRGSSFRPDEPSVANFARPQNMFARRSVRKNPWFGRNCTRGNGSQGHYWANAASFTLSVSHGSPWAFFRFPARCYWERASTLLEVSYRASRRRARLPCPQSLLSTAPSTASLLETLQLAIVSSSWYHLCSPTRLLTCTELGVPLRCKSVKPKAVTATVESLQSHLDPSQPRATRTYHDIHTRLLGR